TQTLTVSDTTDPTFIEDLQMDKAVGCNSIPTADTLTATDDCGSAGVSFSESTTPGGCSGEFTIYRVWTATDACGNDTIHTQVVSVSDNTDPVWVNAPTDMNVTCEEDYETEFQNWLSGFSGTDSCGNAFVTNDNSGPIACAETREVLFTLTDECGNSISLSATFFVEETLGLPEAEDESVILHPNPASDAFQISGLLVDGKIEVFNIAGQTILKRPITDDEIIPVNWRAGVYIIKIFEADRITIKRLVIK
ncbi:MAG: T9SS type A sorting domain-containing protein, partial [Bacteroidia bacterium]|nr:T9SS type A sorting domain-containing protein [Bacteroidia bacterium]